MTFWSLTNGTHYNKYADADADVASADLKIQISRKFFNILTRNLEHIFIFMYFIYSVHYFVVWKHVLNYFSYFGAPTYNFRVNKSAVDTH